MNEHVKPPGTPDLEKRTDQYIKLRDKIDEIEERHTKELKPYREALETLGSVILGHLNDLNVMNVKTTAGTPHKKLDASVTIVDKEAFWTWVVTQGKFDYLDYKANKTAVKKHVDDLVEQSKGDPSIVPAPPPGINYSTRWKIGVTRGK